jgi:hypothetical protein
MRVQSSSQRLRPAPKIADVLPCCSAVVTYGGHGTVIKALAAEVPLAIARSSAISRVKALPSARGRSGHVRRERV